MILANLLAFFLIVFLLALITAAIAYLGFLKMKADHSDVVESDLSYVEPGVHHGEAGGLGPAGPSPLLKTDRLSTITFWDSILARFDFGSHLRTRLEDAELDWSVGRVTSMMLLIGVIVLAVVMRIAPLWLALLGAVFAMFIPYNYIQHRRQKRFQKFRELFPDVLDSLSRALRAGYPLSAAMEMIAAETSPPVSNEIRRTSTEANLGRGWPQALENLGRRIPLLEINLFIGAVTLHSRTGGKLSEVLTELAENMREATALQGEVKSLAAHGKLTGVILTILPIGIAIMMMIVSPGYMQILIHHPWGKNLIAAAVACLILAHIIIRKLVDIRI
jgi:tight adherence protein B